MKVKEGLRSCSKGKETKQIWQLNPIHDPRLNTESERKEKSREAGSICLFDFCCDWHHWGGGKRLEWSLRVRWTCCVHVDVLILMDLLWYIEEDPCFRKTYIQQFKDNMRHHVLKRYWKYRESKRDKNKEWQSKCGQTLQRWNSTGVVLVLQVFCKFEITSKQKVESEISNSSL